MKTFVVGLLASLFLLSSCATVQQNIDARAVLAQCRYDYSGVSVTGIQFGSGIAIDSVDFNVLVKITNPTKTDAAVDHANLSFFLDKHPVLDLAHPQFVRIPAGKSEVNTVAVTLPFSGIAATLGHRPEVIGVKAKLWMTLLVGKDTWETPVVIPVEFDVPIPYDQIDALVMAKKKELEDQAKKEAELAAKKTAEEASKRAADAVRSTLPSAPHF